MCWIGWGGGEWRGVDCSCGSGCGMCVSVSVCVSFCCRPKLQHFENFDCSFLRCVCASLSVYVGYVFLRCVCECVLFVCVTACVYVPWHFVALFCFAGQQKYHTSIIEFDTINCSSRDEAAGQANPLGHSQLVPHGFCCCCCFSWLLLLLLLLLSLTFKARERSTVRSALIYKLILFNFVAQRVVATTTATTAAAAAAASCPASSLCHSQSPFRSHSRIAIPFPQLTTVASFHLAH